MYSFIYIIACLGFELGLHCYSYKPADLALQEETVVNNAFFM
jgi:hypothetical protein